MSDLERHLNRLLSFARERGLPAGWSRIVILEAGRLARPRPPVPRTSLIPAEEYVQRFDSHLGAGHAWINMSVAGMLDAALLVVIELPTYKNNVPEDKVSVNLSGPNLLNGTPEWDASKFYRLVD